MTNEVNVNEEDLEALLAELEGSLADGEPLPVAAAAPTPEPAVEAAPWEEPAPNAETAQAVQEASDNVTEKFESAEELAADLDEKAAAAKPVAVPVEVIETEADVTPPSTTPPRGLKYFVNVDQFRKDTIVSETNMDEAMMHQSGLRAFYGAQAAYAEGQASTAKAKFEVLECALYDQHRKILAQGAEKVTEKMVEAAVKGDPRWLKGKTTVIEAETIAGVNKGLTFSLADRRDMLIQLGADRREENKGQLRITEADTQRQSLQDRARAAATRSKVEANS